MAVRDRDRKILWGRSGNRCAICRHKLVAERTEADREAVIGEEAHIAAQSTGGPRWGELPPGVDVDSYENLVLLCSIHHKVIDDQVRHYTAALLRDLKGKHEQWVQRRLSDADLPRLSDPFTGPLTMAALSTGAAVWALITSADAFLLQPPADEDTSEEGLRLADELLDLCRDLGDIHDDIAAQGAAAIREAKRELQRLITALAHLELLVFGTHQVRVVPGGEPPLVFQVAVLAVVGAQDPDLRRT